MQICVLFELCSKRTRWKWEVEVPIWLSLFHSVSPMLSLWCSGCNFLGSPFTKLISLYHNLKRHWHLRIPKYIIFQTMLEGMVSEGQRTFLPMKCESHIRHLRTLRIWHPSSFVIVTLGRSSHQWQITLSKWQQL